jgi:hypothetical protein
LANLSPSTPPPMVKTPPKKLNNNDDKLKKLELNLNSFNKKYNDAMSSNDATKSKRMKRIVDVSYYIIPSFSKQNLSQICSNLSNITVQ